MSEDKNNKSNLISFFKEFFFKFIKGKLMSCLFRTFIILFIVIYAIYAFFIK